MKTEKKTVTLNTEQKLYVIPEGDGFTCLGFDRCNFLAVHLARELATFGHPIPQPAAVGTLERYAQYRALVDHARKVNQISGWRSQAELTPELIGLEHKRVEVTHEWQPGKPEKTRFYVGKSTGFIPCHLELKRRNSSGGGAVCLGSIKSVKVIYER